VIEQKLIKSLCWVSHLQSFPLKCAIFVGWVEARNPTLQIGLNPTYPKPDFSSMQYLLSIPLN